MARGYQIFENGIQFAYIEARGPRQALRIAARTYPRRAVDYNRRPTDEEYWERWLACEPGKPFAASAQVLIPSTGTLYGAGRDVYETE